MSFYRSILATVAATIIAIPAFADDHANANITANKEAPAAVQLSENNTTAKETAQQGAKAEETKININKATEKELIKVKGLNASKVRAIVKYRGKHGDFKSLNELAKVRGFTKMKADDLKNIQDQLAI